MGINGRRPFMEMVEVAQSELVREAASNQEDKYKGFINQVYLNELPSLLPEDYIKKEAFITVVNDYTAGTITVGTGTTGAPGVATSWTSANTNMFLKVNGFNRLNRVTYSADTLLLFQSSLAWVEASGTGLSYTLFQDRYALASDFAYMIADDPEDPNVVSRYINGTHIFLDPLDNETYDSRFNGTVGQIHAYTVKWLSTAPYLFTLFAPDSLDIIRYHYIPQLTTLTEYTTGTITFTTGTAVIAAGAALWTTNVDTSANTYFIRNDADGTGSASKWYQISTVTNDTALSLAAAFGGTSGAGITYTISQVSKWPVRFDDAILYKAALIADPDNTQSKKWQGLYTEAVAIDRTVESHRKHVRPLKQFFGKRR